MRTSMRILAIAGLHAVLLTGATVASTAAGGPVVAAMDDSWQSVLRRWVGNGWKPFHGDGYNFQVAANTPKRWGAGLVQDQAVAFAAICDACSGVRMRLLDQRGGVLAQGKTVGNATALTAVPMASEKGSIELTAVGCRAPTCVIRYTSFSKR